MINEKTIRPGSQRESIDFTKLWVVVRQNRVWLALIFLVVNAASLLYLRYTKNLYESSSQLKLEVKDDATELGIKNVVEDQNVNLLSGEIELMQSNLFLGKVLAETPLEVSYYSIGRVLNEELFSRTPFRVAFSVKDPSVYNVPLYVDEINRSQYALSYGEKRGIRGEYGKRLELPEATLTLMRDDGFAPGDEVGYYFTLNSKDHLLKYLSRNFTVEPLNYNANTVRLAFRDHNPNKAQAILSKIDTLYLEFSYEQKNLANRKKIEWLSEQLQQIEGKMEGYEDYFETFTLQNKTNDLDEDVRRTIAQIHALDSQRYQHTQRMNQLAGLSGHLRKEDFTSALRGRQYLPEAVNRNIESLHALVLEQDKLRLSYRESTFAYRQRQKEIEALREKVLKQLDEIGLEAARQLKSLNGRKARLEQEFAGLPDKTTEFSKNLRYYKLNEQLYLTLMQSKAEFEVVQAGSVPDFKILSPATFPSKPIAPKKALIFGAGLVGSVMLMILLTATLYLVNDRITSLSEIEYTMQLPVLGVVPASRSIREDILYVVEQPKSMVSEAIRTMRTNLDFFNLQSGKKVITISSTVSGEGKSFITSNLAAMIAMSGKRVIVVDLDMRKRRKNESAPKAGLSTVLIGRDRWEDCVRKSSVANLDLLPAGPHPPNPAELLLTPAFLTTLDGLKSEYDYVLVDTPPVGLVADGIEAMKHADLNVYIFRANYSRHDFLMNLQRIININKFTNITMVLNALPTSNENKYGYGYYEEAERTPRWKQLLKHSV